MTEKKLKNNKAPNIEIILPVRKKKYPKKTRIAKEKSFEEILHQQDGGNRMKKSVTQELLKMKKAETEARVYSPPYAYIYADYLKSGKYEKIVRAIENRLTDLGISGRIHRLSQFKNLEELIGEDLRRGITTIVMIGDDKLARDAINVLAGLNAVLGIIPLGGENKIASLLGIPEGTAACDVLSQRILSRLDVGRINNKIFFSRLYIAGQRAPIICNGQYEIFSPGGDIVVYNSNVDGAGKSLPTINSRDGRFEVLVRPKQPRLKFFSKKEIRESLFFAKKLKMESQTAFSIFVDGKKVFYKNVIIEIMPLALKAIVGKSRKI